MVGSRHGLHSKSLGARRFLRLVSSPAPELLGRAQPMATWASARGPFNPGRGTMLDRRNDTSAPKPGKRLPPAVWAAKFPPDDDAPMGGGAHVPGAPGGGYADDGNFKRGRFARSRSSSRSCSSPAAARPSISG